MRFNGSVLHVFKWVCLVAEKEPEKKWELGVLNFLKWGLIRLVGWLLQQFGC
jgi:hypothetical protein